MLFLPATTTFVLGHQCEYIRMAKRQVVGQHLGSDMFIGEDMVIMLLWASYENWPPGLIYISTRDAGVEVLSF